MGKDRTVGELLRDPSSNLFRHAENARRVMRENEKVIASYTAQGMSEEQAWKVALFGKASDA